MKAKLEQLGQDLFEAYSDSADWKNFRGGPVPRWDDAATKGDLEMVLPQSIRDHWMAAAVFVLRLMDKRDV